MDQSHDSPSADVVFQMRVVLAGVSPMVWRRLLVPASTSIADLHETFQCAFGWSDEGLHRFTVHGVEYGCWRPGSAGFSTDARRVALARFGLRIGERFTYDYDFFAGWRLEVRVEQILPRSPRRRYPACTGGARQAPPESCRSVEEFLKLRMRWPLVIVAGRLAGFLDCGDDRERAADFLAEHRDELTALTGLARLDDFDKNALNTALHALDPTTIRLPDDEPA
ncbi:plasmid pRiA4b ORF-3 family protein [Spongiactinospora sp. TRM90649]|uniref:plasmid pRiA4b ORF-3 family protein n=1 Tax=Spongiactinospora sp. TRM90649 TaxID=3031114 RepID=UPI0023F91BF1|nr:plasmid pRiA4b ORF-3 family protein [Spongiactinospora sp. TRM90649]MDF5757337.1 plasmid pRiA4b ORF-3 family protein [Spongiactinospora sp. TRM90649]